MSGMLKIGSRTFKSNVILAALAGCADLSFRLIAREHGAELCFSEMSDCNSLQYTSRGKVKDIHQTHPQDIPLAAQLLGADPELMLKGALRILDFNDQLSFIDINAACPVNKVIKKKAGAYLLHSPEKFYRVIDKLAAVLPLPVTVKIRIGYTKSDVAKIVRIAQGCERSGAQAIFVHGRTRKQMYSGEVDCESIKAIKDNVKVPVIASGNIFSPQNVKEMMSLTGCDGVLVARGAFGNPWIFEQIKRYFAEGVILPEPTLEEKLAVLVRHLQYIEKYKLAPTRVKVGFSRKVAIWYFKNFKHAAALRAQAGRVQSFPEFYDLIASIQVGREAAIYVKSGQ